MNFQRGKIPPFVMWWTNAFPTVFAPDLSQLEILQRVIALLNDVIEQSNGTVDEVNRLSALVTTIQHYVDNYFDTLDVQTEVNNKLDDMVEDGTFDSIIRPIVEPYINQIEENNRAFQSSIEAHILAQDDEITRIRNMVGSPLTASNHVDMVDTNKVYVYVGTETEYLYGYWYYYDGNSWALGGPYNSTAVQTDTTLSVAGMAADAKVTGDSINEIKEAATVETEVTTDILPELTLTSGYMDLSGRVQSGSYKYTNQIAVNPGDILSMVSGSFRFVTAFADASTAVSSKGSNNTTLYTVPDGIAYVVLSLYNSATSVMYTTTLLVNSLNSRVASLEDSVEDLSDTVDNINTNLDGFNAIHDSVIAPYPSTIKAASLAASESISTNLVNAVKRYGVYSFYCKLTAQPTGYIVFGKDSERGSAIGISSTNYALYDDGALQSENPHGLTLKDYIYAVVEKTSETKATIRIATNGNSFSVSNVNWEERRGAPYVSNESGVTINDVTFTWNSEAFTRTIWIFGDSYVSYSPDRWRYYMNQWGFNTNLMFNGYSGESSSPAYDDFVSCLTYGKPAFAVWCLGMNNGDSSSVNSTWLTKVQAFISQCEYYGITPILATIPCTPNVNNSYKNAWVRASGYRYVDFADAVNIALDSTQWYDGMLSNDNVHPTTQGAIALATRVLCDVPEILRR